MIRFCTERPRLVLVLVLVATAVFGAAAARVKVDPSVEGMLPGDDADGIYYSRFLERFGSDEVVFVALRTPHPFGATSLGAVRRISDGLKAVALEPEQRGGKPIRLIDRVLSPTTVTQPRGGSGRDGERELVLEPLVRDLPSDEGAERDLWQRASSDPLLVRNLISSPSNDGPAGESTLLILGRIVDRPGDLAYRAEITRQVRELVETELANAPTLHARASVGGVPVLKASVAELTLSEILRIDPLAWAANAILVFFLFRRLRATGLALAVAAVSLLWTLGFLTLLGSSLNILSIVVLGLVKALAVVTSIHVLTGYRNLATAGGERSEIACEAVERVALPSFISTLTTSLGCMGLAVSGIESMREVGVFSAFGVMVGWALSMTFLPALLSLHPGRELQAPGSWIGSRIGDTLARLVEPALSRPAWTIVVVLGLTAVAATGVLRLRVESNVIAMLDQKHPVRVAFEQIGSEVSGIQPLEISLRTSSGHALDADVLERVEKFQDWLETQPGVDQTISIVDYLKRMHGSLQGDGIAGERLPETKEQAQTLLFLAESQDRENPMSAWLQPSWEEPTHLRVTARHQIYSAEEISALVAASRDYLGREFMLHDDISGGAEAELEPGQFAGGVTGVVVLFADMRDTLLAGQWKSWMIALSVIWIALMAAMRSLRTGTIAMIPNTLPSIVMFGLMGWADIPLDIATGLTAAISTAIADDDTIHLLSHYRERLSHGDDPRRAIREAIRDVGPVILLAGCVLAAGFFTFLAASFAPLYYFGVLAGSSVLTGVLYDLFLLPALLLVGRRNLEAEPVSEIPLSSGARLFRRCRGWVEPVY